MGRLTLFAACVAFFASTVYCNIDSLRIDSDQSKLLILEGDDLMIKCVHTDSGSQENVIFLKDGTVLPQESDKYKTSNKKKYDGEVVWTTILTVNNTEIGDSGNYTCQSSDGSRTSSLTVSVFKVKNHDADLPVPVKGQKPQPVYLQCEVIGVPSVHQRSFAWERDGFAVTEGDKYEIFLNGTLKINNPSRADAGEYKCSITFFPSSDNEKQTFTPKPCALRAGPVIDSHDNNKNMVQGDTLELKCTVSGYPTPKISWSKDGASLNLTSKRIHLDDTAVTNGKLLIYSLEDSDSGLYSCLASNMVPPYNASAEMRVRVKDKLAALWPFLGIVAEVIVLCVIILVYEKRRSKKLADEDDAVDSNVDNTVDNKDVRHRRT